MQETASNKVGSKQEDLDITVGNKVGRTRHWHRQQGRCKLRISEDLEMAIDNEIGGTRHAHWQSDRWKQRRLPTTRSVATSSGSNIAVETMWDVGNSVDNKNQDQLASSGINRFRNWIQRVRTWNQLLGDFLSHSPFFMESGVPVNSGINRFRNCSQSCPIATSAAIKSKSSTTAVVTSL